MARINDLLHGEAADVAAILDGDSWPISEPGVVDMRAALSNAMTRIAQLEKRLDAEATKISRLQRANRSSFEA